MSPALSLGCRGEMEILATVCPKSTTKSCIKIALFSIHMLINKMRGLGVWGPFFPLVSLLFKRIEAVFLFHPCCCSNPVSSAPTFFLLANTNLICNENIATQSTLSTSTSIISHQTITRKSKSHLFLCFLS